MNRILPIMSEPLHVIAVISNPVMFASRERLCHQFVAKMLATKGVELWVAELAFGERPFAVTKAHNTRHIQVRGTDEVWHKENLINLAMQRLPQDAKYIAWVDADIEFVDPNWALETVHALQHYRILQPFGDCIDLGPRGEVVQLHKSFGGQFIAGAPSGGAYGQSSTFWHPGYAWAARRETLDKLGGLIDWAILGSADHHMALAMIGQAEKSLPGGIHPNYRKALLQWQERAKTAVNMDIGHLPGTILHNWHGRKRDRKYVERWSTLIRHEYDPEVDIVRDTRGVVHLAGNKHHLRNDLRIYFRSRNEDSIDLE